MPKGLQQLICNSLNHYGQQNALWIKDNYYTYAELGQKVNAIINIIKNLAPGQKLIGIVTHDTFETYASFLATWLSGKGFVPIIPSFPLERVKNIIDQSEIKTLLIADNVYDTSNLDVNIIATPKLENGNSEVKTNLPVDDDAIACMLFTSGSTGIPKGVPMTYKNIETTLDAYSALQYGPNLEDRCLQMFEFTFDMSLISYLPALLSGACVYSVVDDKFRFITAFNVMQDFKLTFAVFVPSTLVFMQRYFQSFHFPELKCCLVGGEPFSVALADQWQNCAPQCRIISISGPTETTMACMGYEVQKEKARNKHLNGILAFGLPWKNTQAIVVNNQLEILPPNEKGELCFSGNNIMEGYWKNPERNKKVFFTTNINGKEEKFYRTGDCAFMDEEGDFLTCGRIDFQVKIQGYRVDPGEIEAVALEHCGQGLLAAIPYQKHEGFYAIRLFIEKGTPNRDTLMDKFKSKLPPYMIPEAITTLDKLPLNLNGKIDRQELKCLLETE